MSTRKERFEKTRELIMSDDVQVVEAILHIYYWYRFERAVSLRNKYILQGGKFAEKINADLEVFKFRAEMKGR